MFFVSFFFILNSFIKLYMRLCASNLIVPAVKASNRKMRGWIVGAGWMYLALGTVSGLDTCKWIGALPCSWDECCFILDKRSTLIRTGNCTEICGTLYLDERGIRHLAPNVFARMAQLQRLRLNGNLLNDVPPGVFSNLLNLTLHTLRHDNIKTMPSTIFDGLLRSLSDLYLYNNPLTCANMT